MVSSRFGLAVIAVVASSSLAQATEHRGSMEDQLACTPDVYRLCAAQVPDEDAIVACLQRNRTALSPGCAKVFSKPDPGSTNQQDDD